MWTCLTTQACSNFTCSIHVHYRNANMAFTMNSVSANKSVAIRRAVLQATVLMKCLLLKDLFLNLSKRTNFCRWSTAGMFAVKQENPLRISTGSKATSHGCSDGFRISQTVSIPRLWAKTYYLAFLPKTAWKWKKLDREGEGTHPWCPLGSANGMHQCLRWRNKWLCNQSVALSQLQLLTNVLWEYTYQ